MKLVLRLLVFSSVLVPAAATLAQIPPSAPRPITIDDYFRIRAVRDPQLSPDARFVTYTVQTALLKEDKNEERIWMVATAGGEALPLTAAGVSSSHARWSPDGSSIAFLSAHEAGKAQVWLLPRHGGEAERLKRLGRPTELVVYPGEYGEFKTASRIKDRLERYLAWCNHYVNGDPAPARPPESPAPASKPL
jgi:dipeptidyl aminopeptidase/acylaminoacyl peptidase